MSAHSPSSLTVAWEQLRQEAAHCRACPLWEKGGPTVFGEGPLNARLVLVGEQPGDQEDRAGRPFVGPAGRLLDEALAKAGLSREAVYLTNAVKHFKWTARGKRRLHETPNASEVRACRRWLDAELALLNPPVLVALGATASRALFGPEFRVSRQRGQWISSHPWRMGTLHPAAILRIPNPASRAQAQEHFFADLQQAATTAARSSSVPGQTQSP